MFRAKIFSLLVMAFAILLSSCAPDVQNTLPPGWTLASETDTPQQATATPDIFTQTLEPVTYTPTLSDTTVPPSSSELKTPDSETPANIVTAPPPIVEYNNSTVGYRLNLPGNWIINETNSLSKETIFSSPYAESFVVYLSISIDSRDPGQIVVPPGTIREDTLFYGKPAIKFTYSFGRIEYLVPVNGKTYLIVTDKPDDGMVQSILMTIQFTTSSSTTYYVTLADNGKTFYMKIGDELRINLDMSYIWSIASISDPTVIVGAQAGYFAFANGMSTLTMTGNPVCYSSTPPCLAPSIVFMLTVIVR